METKDIFLHILNLLSTLPLIFLDEYVIDVIKDPSVLIKLLLVKIGSCHVIYRSVKLYEILEINICMYQKLHKMIKKLCFCY